MDESIMEYVSSVLDDQLWPRTAESHLVQRVQLHGATLVVKRVCQGSMQEERLERERRNYADMLRDNVPGLAPVAASVQGALVLEEVGEELRWHDGALWVGAVRLTERERREVCEAAKMVLRGMHAAGWMFYNVEMRHCRVEWREGWKVWWLDLGCAAKGKSTVWDLEECDAMFQGVGVEEITDWVRLGGLLKGFEDWTLPPFVERDTDEEGD